MKKSLYILLFILAITACNHTNHFTRTLDDIDTLIINHPDSAYSQLQHISSEVGKQNIALRMRYELMMTDAKNKLYTTLDNDSAMKEVVEYFDVFGTNNEQIRAHYLLGCVYRDLDDYPSALRCYNDAIELADTTSTSHNNSLLCNIYGQTMLLYREQRSPELLIEAARNYGHYAMKDHDVLQSLVAEEYVIHGYNLLGKDDSVLIKSTKLINRFQAAGFYKDATYLMPTLIRIHLKKGNYKDIKHFMHVYETKSGVFEGDCLRDKTKESYYGLKGNYYEGIGKLDSAVFFYNKILHSQYIDCRIDANKGLLSVMKKRGNYSKAIEYADTYCRLTDSLAILRSAKEINRMTAIYNYNNQNAKRELAERKSRNYRIALTLSIALFVIVIAVGIIIYRRHRKIEIQKLKAINTRYLDTLMQISKTQDELSQLKTDSMSFRKEKENEIQRLQKKMEEYYAGEYDDKPCEQERQIYTHPVVQKVHKAASTGQCITEQEKQRLKDMMQEGFPAFYACIMDETKGLTEKDQVVCILIRLRFIPSEIAFLMDMSVQSSTNLRARINKKLFRQSGAKTLNSRLMALS